MNHLQEQILLLFSIPIYAILIPLEIVLSHFHNWKFYSWKETLMNIYLNLVNAGVDLLMRGVALAVLIFFAQYSLNIHLHPVVYWVSLLFFEDFLFWLEHYVDHSCRIFWAIHVTHHSSEEYNLTTGFRSSVLMPLYRFIYFIPLALLGYQPIDILFMYAITQIYGILVHTQAVGRLPKWIEYIFVTPTHHKVHHASNIPYLDKNMGMVFIIWDRLFGTFTNLLPEEPPRYGLSESLKDSKHPVKIIFHEWKNISDDLKKKVPLRSKLGYLFMPPGWSHDGSKKTAKQLRAEWTPETSPNRPNKEEDVIKAKMA